VVHARQLCCLKRLGLARQGEGDRAWWAGAGTAALATGLVQAAWVCARIAALGRPVSATTRLDQWDERGLMLWSTLGRGHRAVWGRLCRRVDLEPPVQTLTGRRLPGSVSAGR
jgi:hypothetical protein